MPKLELSRVSRPRLEQRRMGGSGVRTADLSPIPNRDLTPALKDVIRTIKAKAQEARRLGLHWTGYYYKDIQVR